MKKNWLQVAIERLQLSDEEIAQAIHSYGIDRITETIVKNWRLGRTNLPYGDAEHITIGLALAKIFQFHSLNKMLVEAGYPLENVPDDLVQIELELGRITPKRREELILLFIQIIRMTHIDEEDLSEDELPYHHPNDKDP